VAGWGRFSLYPILHLKYGPLSQKPASPVNSPIQCIFLISY
jgi:hypothetical protein